MIVSPLARNTWKGDGSYNDLLEEYAKACRSIAEKENVPYIDLHAYSMDFVVKNGRETARRWYFPSDYTHTNDYGAYMYAGFVYSRMCELGLVPGIYASETEGSRAEDFESDWMPPEEPPVITLPTVEGDESDAAVIRYCAESPFRFASVPSRSALCSARLSRLTRYAVSE